VLHRTWGRTSFSGFSLVPKLELGNERSIQYPASGIQHQVSNIQKHGDIRKMSLIPFRSGCEVLVEKPPSWLRTARIGLLANQASVAGPALLHVKDLIAQAGGRITCLFSPQHGFHSEKQANMIESPDGRDFDLEIPVVSLYSGTRQPSREALEKIDVLLVDLQDVGTRVYTYSVTMGLCLEAAAETGVRVVILDRPNPLGGMEIEGNILDLDYRSFVGRYAVPMRHGLTMGEFARFISGEYGVPCDLEVVAMEGWRRECYFPEIGIPWVFPSPNMPTWETALLYPGMVLLEGTNISEGRGTALPFQLFGAPFLDQKRFLQCVDARSLAGAVLRPVCFEPVFDKHRGQTCKGFQIHVTGRTRFRPYRIGLALLRAFCLLHPETFRWLAPPYEYEWKKLPADILLGSGPLREKIEKGVQIAELESEWASGLAAYGEKRGAYLLYPQTGP
jgi:uncharacterized protein YbbC (DUF1343 family)